jgi:hypothetical protein
MGLLSANDFRESLEAKSLLRRRTFLLFCGSGINHVNIGRIGSVTRRNLRHLLEAIMGHI